MTQSTGTPIRPVHEVILGRLQLVPRLFGNKLKTEDDGAFDVILRSEIRTLALLYGGGGAAPQESIDPLIDAFQGVSTSCAHHLSRDELDIIDKAIEVLGSQKKII